MNTSETRQLYIARVSNPAAPEFYQITVSDERTTSRSLIDTNGTKVAFVTDNPDFAPSSIDADQIVMADISDPETPVIMSLTAFRGDEEVDDMTARVISR